MTAPLAHGEELVLGEFAIGSEATDLNGFRLDQSAEGDPSWVVGARVSDLVGGNSGRAMVDLGHQNSGMRFSVGVQLDWDDPVIPGAPARNAPFSFGSEQSRQATPYVGLGYVGRISDQFEITLDAGANYLGTETGDTLTPSLELDNNGSVYGWSPTVTLSGRIRF